MRFRSAMTVALAASFMLGGCAAAVGAGGPLVSATGVEYEPGTPPSDTRFSTTGMLYIAQGRFEDALAQAREGIDANPENPVHYSLAGSAYANLGRFTEANEMWREAQRIFPAYELEIEPEREGFWADQFNLGVEAYNEGDVAGALEHWRNANLVYDLRPEGFQNLALVLTQEGEYNEAIEAYNRGLASLERRPASRVLEEEEIEDRIEIRALLEENLAILLLHTEQFAEAEALIRAQLARDPADVQAQSNLAMALSRQGREAEAAQIYTQLLQAPDLDGVELFNIGVSLFNAEDYLRAAEAFERVTRVQPDSRDAWYNYANALYAAEEWARLVPVAERLVRLDPLVENTSLILARAFRETGDSQAALRTLEANHEQPVHLDDLQMRPTTRETTIIGRVIGNQAAAGTPVQLRFHFYDDAGRVGSETVTVNAPAFEQMDVFQVTFGQTATAYSYELVQ
jgi:tetratricopeptide (TPR) repeat protein